jgi:type VII secretion protein EccB
MTSRRDQVQAYRFLTRRIVSAMLDGEPETNELPMRRFAFAMIGGLVVGALVFAGFAVYGLVRPGGGKPAAKTILVERETGAKYLYIEGRLHPVLNWASARLILGESRPAVRTMARSSLREVPRGRPVGIPDAPDALPDKKELVGLPWSVCSAPRSAGSLTLGSYVLIGHTPPGGSAVAAEAGLLVRAGQQRYLLWSHHRLRVPDNATLAALGWASVPPLPVAGALLNALPAGPDLVAPRIAGDGDPAPEEVDGETVAIGELFRAADQLYVMVAGGLAPVGALASRLLTASGRQVNEISVWEAGRLLVGAGAGAEPPGYPPAMPRLRDGEGVAAVCAAYRDPGAADAPVVVETYARAGAELTVPADQPPAGAGTDGVATADRAVLPGGRAALVRAQPVPGSAATGTVYLVTDQGLKYAIPQQDSEKVIASLGYAGVTPVPVPTALLALVPTSVALDPRAAALFAPPPAVVEPTRSPG